MGARGPRKKHPDVEMMEGRPGKRPVYDSGLRGKGKPQVLDHLCDDAKKCLEVIERSMPEIYAEADTFILTAFATAWANSKRAAEEIWDPDFDPTTKRGGPDPWWKIFREQTHLMVSLGDRLGLDPKSRALLPMSPESEEVKSKFQGLVVLRGGQSESSSSSSAS